MPTSSKAALDGRPRVVVITGAAGALGTAVAQRLAGEAPTDLVLCDLSAERLERTAATLEHVGGRTVTRVADVADPEAVDAAVSGAVDRFGRLDVMINNAAVLSSNGRIHNLAPEEWSRQLEVTFLGAVHGTTSAVRVMRGQDGGGSIINTASVAGLTAWPYAAPYCAAKAAVVQLTKVAAVEYATERIRVNCVCPGMFESAMSADIPDAARPGLTARHPLGVGTPQDLVGAFSYLAGPDSRWTTGSALVVDGGYAAP
ncbi:SDR family oxidoreductase [Pseudonocardia sp. C8]|uniref:SDR family NAD(P)-dependent oxidoreductase n=1 Tax=Pseudonocardia sp. C8 TaxID=2762759 RepID=UPI0016428BBB|nr:SDR family oxidoreductase [Pseudonocardia sp. C8]MBC3192985.1 SDR family oxidoreductase [Pseudonocardia sp. C8]